MSAPDPYREPTMARHCRHHEVQPPDFAARDSGHRCALGIDIRKHVGGPDFGWLARSPCYLPNATNPGHVPCDKAEKPTAEEIEAYKRETQEMIAQSLKKMAVVAEVKRTRKGGQFPCPACGGTLTISIASNGHTMGRCTGKDCSSWIE